MKKPIQWDGGPLFDEDDESPTLLFSEDGRKSVPILLPADVNRCGIVDFYHTAWQLLLHLSDAYGGEPRTIKEVKYEGTCCVPVLRDRTLTLPPGEIVDIAIQLSEHAGQLIVSTDDLCAKGDAKCGYLIGRIYSATKEHERAVGDRLRQTGEKTGESNRERKWIVSRDKLIETLKRGWGRCRQKERAYEWVADQFGKGKSTIRNRIRELEIEDSDWCK